MITKFAKCDPTAELKTSYQFSLTLVKHGKAFWGGEIIKKCAVRMALTFGDEEQTKSLKSCLYLIKPLQEK